jgi:DNA-binding NarL/FixJ family response regulator
MNRNIQSGDAASHKYFFAQRPVETELRPISLLGMPRKQPAAPLSRPTVFDLFAVIDNRALERECFVLCLQQQCEGARVVGFESIADWRASVGDADIRQVILTNIGARQLTEEGVKDDIRKLVAEAQTVPVVILGAADDVDTVIAALECGAIGYIPPCIHFPNIVEAASVAMAGGIFLSRKSLFALRDVVPALATHGNDVLDQFTVRQLAVAQVLRRGAANKTIAYELKLRESTVKVHVRQIFKKLKATNRTQAAFLLNQMSGWPEDVENPQA